MSKWRDMIKARTSALLQSDDAFAYDINGSEATSEGEEATVQAPPATVEAQIIVLDHIARGDATRIADYIGGNRLVVLDMSETPDDDRIRILDFLSGYMYSEQGKLAKISSHTYIAVPSYVDLYGAFEEDESLYSQLIAAFGSAPTT